MKLCLWAVMFGTVSVCASKQAPCDVFSAAGTPCVAAHSVVRALYAAYTGPLYVVQRDSDKQTKEIGVKSGGLANSSDQERFCAHTSCTIERILDQSPRANHLHVAPGGGGSKCHAPDKGVNAMRHPFLLGGHTVYGAYFEGLPATGYGMGYRNDNTSGIATGDDAETMYIVTDGKHFNGHCCFDYGNAETDDLDDGPGTMEALYFGSGTHSWSRGNGDGPWVMADLEVGIYAGGQKGPWKTLPSLTHDFVTALIKGKSGKYGIKGGNAQKGTLDKFYEGKRPKGYEKMKKQGAIVLGIGGDNGCYAVGTFYEGAMVSGYTSDSTDNELQANIVDAGYGLQSSFLKSDEVLV